MVDRTFVCSSVSWKPSGVCGKHGLCRRRGWIFTDEAGSFEGSLEEPEENPDGGQSEDSFASVSEFTGFTSGEAEEDFSGEEDFVAPDSQDGFEGEADPTTLLESDMQDEGGYLQNLTLYTSQSGVSTVALKRSADLDAEFGGKVYVAEYGSNMDSASFGSQQIWLEMRQMVPPFSWKPPGWMDRNRTWNYPQAPIKTGHVTT